MVPNAAGLVTRGSGSRGAGTILPQQDLGAVERGFSKIAAIKENKNKADAAKIKAFEDFAKVNYESWKDRDKKVLFDQYSQFKDSAVKKFKEKQGNLSYDDWAELEKSKKGVIDLGAQSKGHEDVYTKDVGEMRKPANRDKIDFEKTMENMSQLGAASIQDTKTLLDGMGGTTIVMKPEVEEQVTVDFYEPFKQAIKPQYTQSKTEKGEVTTRTKGLDEAKLIEGVERWSKTPDAETKFKAGQGKMWNTPEEMKQWYIETGKSRLGKEYERTLDEEKKGWSFNFGSGGNSKFAVEAGGDTKTVLGSFDTKGGKRVEGSEKYIDTDIAFVRISDKSKTENPQIQVNQSYYYDPETGKVIKDVGKKIIFSPTSIEYRDIKKKKGKGGKGWYVVGQTKDKDGNITDKAVKMDKKVEADMLTTFKMKKKELDEVMDYAYKNAYGKKGDDEIAQNDDEYSQYKRK